MPNISTFFHKNLFLYIFSLFIWIIVSIFFIFHSVQAEKWFVWCEWKFAKEKYKCQIKKYCNPRYKPFDKAYKSKKYFWKTTKKQDPFKKWKKIYRENQNNIYKCSLIHIQKKSINLVKEELIKTDKTWKLSAAMQSKLQLQLRKLKAISKKSKCKNGKLSKYYWKKELLKESIYETCKYSYYLDYLRWYYTHIKNLPQTEKEKKLTSFDNRKLALKTNRIQADINTEEQHTYMMFHTAFQSYVHYETNFPIHVLFSFIKEDFNIYRKKLYQVLWPINQVVYKIANAMAAP